jgi:DNA-binding NtrC family response regulator
MLARASERSMGGKRLRSLSRSPRALGQNGDVSSVMVFLPRILVVDDDQLICQQLEHLYRLSGYAVATASSAEEALSRLQTEDIDLVVTDVRLPGISGIAFTGRIKEMWPNIPVIVITGYGDISTAVEVLKNGADDYIVKPFSATVIQASTQTVLEKARIFTEIRHLQRSLKEQYAFSGMLSKMPQMHQVFTLIRQVAPTDVTVLIEGETGTGKELVAQAIHHQSNRRTGPFVAINCAGLPDTLLESELFGYERGAFTGANQARPGKIELAHGGTLFLDETESMPLAMQAKLLLVLQNQKVQRLGGTHWTQVDTRVIAASNVPLENLVAQGQMRRDFFYRINVLPICLLPLRQRREDIPLLVQDFLRHHPVAMQKNINALSPRAMTQLIAHSWPGNVRELQNVLERAIVLATTSVIKRVDLPEEKSSSYGGEKNNTYTTPSTTIPSTVPLRLWLEEQEKQYLVQQLTLYKGRVDVTAKNCGLDNKTLYRKMRLHGLDRKAFSQQSRKPTLLDD